MSPASPTAVTKSEAAASSSPGQHPGIWGPQAPVLEGPLHNVTVCVLSPDTLTAPVHGDGEAPRGVGWPCPHPTAVTPAQGTGIGFL